MLPDVRRFREYLVGKYYIITGSNSDLWKILPMLYNNGFNIFYRDEIILIDLTTTEN